MEITSFIPINGPAIGDMGRTRQDVRGRRMSKAEFAGPLYQDVVSTGKIVLPVFK